MTKVKLSGFRELDKALSELPKATAKNVLRRIAKGALAPMADNAQRLAPRDTGDLQVSIVVSEKRTRRAKQAPKRQKVNGKWRSDPSTGIEMAMGPASGKGVLNYATFREFGRVNQAAHPYMRPAWNGGAEGALDYIKDNLSEAIDKAAARVAKRKTRVGG